MVSVPSTEAARLRSPTRPVPRVGSAPPIPSSVMTMRRVGPSWLTDRSTREAWACLATLASASETTK